MMEKNSLNVLVLGAGKVGNALTRIINEKHDVSVMDKEAKIIKSNEDFDVMHICYPYSEHFVGESVIYINKFNPKLTLIESTVKPGTTHQIFEYDLASSSEVPVYDFPLICHSPVRGLHTNLLWGLETYTKFIGPCTVKAGLLAEKYYQSLEMKTYIAKSPYETECMKLLNLSYYAVQIAFFQEAERVRDKYKLQWDDVLKFFISTTEESNGEIQRPVFKGNHIGGTCVMQGLNKLFSNPSMMAKWINSSNRKLEK